MTRALVTSSKYSPGNMTPQALEALFVGRAKLLKDVLKRLASSATTKEKHFILLVGPRGVGKTHLVALLHHRLTHDPAYASARKRMKIAYLNEEEWGVASFLDLLVRILRALNAVDNDDVLSHRIEQIYSIYDRDPSTALQSAQSTLRQYLGSQTLLLICENLLDIFQGIGVEGQKRWRAWIQEEPFWTILATTPAMFGGLQLQTSPFFGFFTIRNLEKLDFDTATLLLQQKAILDGNSDLAETLRTPTGRARVHAIHHLAGGNHRVYVTMSDFLTRESLDDLVTPFMRMVDDITPYYQDRMRQLAPQQRKIVEFLCHTRRPIVVKEIAHRCLMSQQTAAKQLGELAKCGFVGCTKQGRETYYELAEPLMRICVEVKDNRTEHIKLFVEFLREWFTGRELRMRFDSLQKADTLERTFDKIHIQAAIQEYETLMTEPLFEALDAEITRGQKQNDYAGLAEVAGRLAEERNLAQDHGLLIFALHQDGKLHAAIERAKFAVKLHPKNANIRAMFGALLSEHGRPELALAQLDRAVKLAPKIMEYRCVRACTLLDLQKYEECLRDVEKHLQRDPSHSDWIAMQARALSGLGKHAEAERIARNLVDQKPESAASWDTLAFVLVKQARNEDALDALDKAIAIDPLQVSFHKIRAVTLCALGRFQQALDVLTSVIVTNAEPDDTVSFYRAKCFLELWRLQDAIDEYDRLIQRNPQQWRAYVLKGAAFLILEKTEDGVATCRRLLAAQGDGVNELLMGAAILLDADRADALPLIDRALEISPGDSEAWLLRAKILIELSRYDEAQQAAEQAHRLAPKDPYDKLMICLASTGLAGLVRGTEWLSKILRDRVSTEATSTEAASTEPAWSLSLDELIAGMLRVEARERGAVAMARQISALRKVLAAHAREDLLARSLTTLLRILLRKGGLGADEWVKAAVIMQTVLADLRECAIPLEMLSVAARFAISKDTSVLLELPLEERTLLTQATAAGMPDASDRNEGSSKRRRRD